MLAPPTGPHRGRMKTVILAGGHGTRIGEESAVRPKPMIEIGNQPILWHIMKIYSFHGINDFVVCCGHQGHVIREYFANYALNHSDVTFDLAARRDHHPPERGRSVAGHAHRHRRRHHDRRTPQTGARVRRQRDVLPDLRRWRERREHRRPGRLSPGPGHVRDADRGAAGRPVRRVFARMPAISTFAASRKSRRATAPG